MCVFLSAVTSTHSKKTVAVILLVSSVEYLILMAALSGNRETYTYICNL
jgi:hypothetical protein